MVGTRYVQLRDSVSLRLRATDRVIGAEVVEIGSRPLLRIHSGVCGLKKEHFCDGLDLDVYDESGGHHATENVKVSQFIVPRREVRLVGPVALRAVFKRSTERDSVDLDLVITDYHGRHSVQGRTSDLGGGGLSFATSSPMSFKVGENVRVEIKIKGRNIRATARMAWLAKANLLGGLAFVEVDRDDHDHLYQFIYGLQNEKQR